MSNTKLNEIQVAAKQVQHHLGDIELPLIGAVSRHLAERGISYTEWEQSLSREEDLLQIRLIGRERARKLWGIINNKRNSARVMVQMPVDMCWIVNQYAEDANATLSDAVVSLLEIAIKERGLTGPDCS